MMRESIEYALNNHAEALEYAMQFARDMEPRLAEKFVGMHVNQYTVDAGESIPKAVRLLLDKGYEAGSDPESRRSRIHSVERFRLDRGTTAARREAACALRLKRLRARHN